MRNVMERLINQNFKKNALVIIASSLLFSMTVFFFGPLEIIMSTPGEFWFGIGDIFPLAFFSFLICFFIILSVCWLFSSIGLIPLRVIIAIISGIGLATYIQGNWTFVDYGTMDGQAIDWTNYLTEGVINSLLWIVIILIVFVLFAIKPQSIQYFSYLFFGIVGIELFTLGTLCITILVSSQAEEFSFSVKEELELSKNKENIIVILADGFDGIDFLPILETEPEFRECFDGFTFYEDTCGTSLFSQESAINLLTGNQFEVGLSFEKNVEKAYENSMLYDVLKDNNFETYMYITNNSMVSPQILNYIENDINEKTEIGNWRAAFYSVYKMVGFRYVPHVLKKEFWYSSTDFYDLKDSNTYSWSNLKLHDLLKNQGIIAKETDKNIYQFFWIQGPHEPVVMDRYCNPLDDSIKMSDESYIDGQFEQAVGVVRIYTELVNELKEKGLYDNTTIVLTADHGWDMRQNPLLLVKPAGARGEMKVSRAPVSMIEDYMPTMLYFVTGTKEYGNTIFDLDEYENRNRPFFVYDINSGDRTYNDRETKYYSTGAFFGEYALGKEMLPDAIELYAVSGFSSSEGTHIWTNGRKSELSFDLVGKVEDLMLDVEYYTYGGLQKVSLYVNDYLIEEWEAGGSIRKRISIPNKCLSDDKLEIRFECPNAVSPKALGKGTDERMLALALRKLTIFSHEINSYELGKELSFLEDNTIEKYIVRGFADNGNNFTWTDGNRAEMLLGIQEITTDLELAMKYSTYAGSQRVIVSVNGNMLEDYVATGNEFKKITIPVEYVEDGKLHIQLDLPDAVSPKERGESYDARKLALAMKSMTISQISEND